MTVYFIYNVYFELQVWWVGFEGNFRIYLWPLPEENIWSQWVSSLD